MIHIGKMIQDALQKSGMKKSELAKRLGITHQTINNLCRRPSVNVMTLQRISIELGQDLVTRYVNLTKKSEGFLVLDRCSDEYREFLSLKYECERLNCENQYLKMLIRLFEEREAGLRAERLSEPHADEVLYSEAEHYVN